jgi:hypothetical protein
MIRPVQLHSAWAWRLPFNAGRPSSNLQRHCNCFPDFPGLSNLILGRFIAISIDQVLELHLFREKLSFPLRENCQGLNYAMEPQSSIVAVPSSELIRGYAVSQIVRTTITIICTERIRIHPETSFFLSHYEFCGFSTSAVALVIRQRVHVRSAVPS